MSQTVAAATLISHLFLAPFGAVSDHLREDKPWIAFHADGPVLSLVRVQKAAAPRCEPWLEAMVAVPTPRFLAWSPADGQAGSSAAPFKAWEPSWTGDSIKAVRECDDFPCDVKLDRAEVEAMKKAGAKDGAKDRKDARLPQYLQLIAARTEHYRKTQERPEYEFPGAITDPFQWFDAHGFKSELTRPATPTLFLGLLDLGPGKFLPLHQTLDRRVAQGADQATVWLRDSYTDHYFDSWGEWDTVVCDPDSHEVSVVQAVVAEMDFLKKTNLFARSMAGRYRSAFEEYGTRFLNDQYGRIRDLAEKAK